VNIFASCPIGSEVACLDGARGQFGSVVGDPVARELTRLVAAPAPQRGHPRERPERAREACEHRGALS